LLSVILAAGLVIFSALILIPRAGAAEKKGTYDPWAWSRKNLKPAWMEWGKAYWPTQPVRGGYFRRAAETYIGLMNPNHWPVNDWVSIGYFYEGRTMYNGEYRQRNPWLVESWEFVNPTTVLETFKRGVTFHDGTPMNAHSLKYLFDWIGDRKNGAWTRGMMKRFSSVEVVDDYTIKWTTKKAWGSYPAGFFGFLISQKALAGDVLIREAKEAEAEARKLEQKAEQSGKEEDRAAARTTAEAARKAVEAARDKKNTDQYPVGTGPFMLEDAKPGNYLKVKRNPNWWFGKSVGRPAMPYFDGILVTIIPDPSIQLANLKAGKIDTMGVSKSQYDVVKKDPNLRVYTFLDNFTALLLFNQAGGPLKDIRVRQAVSHALNRKALIAGTQFGLAREASAIYPSDHWAHNPNLVPVSYDPALSKKLLAEAGYSQGLTIKGTSYSDTGSDTVAQAVKHMLAQVGIDWQVAALDPVAVSDRMKNLEYEMSLFGQPYIQDPDGTATQIYHPEGGFHYGRTKNDKIFALIEAGRDEIDEARRQKIYFDLEKALYDDYSDAWLWYNVAVVAYRKNVEGWNNDMWIRDRTLFSSSHPLWFKNGKP
jgi:peptide/nickel transport system substrate-binding protein